MTESEARNKAWRAVELGLIEEEQIEEYIQHLLETHGEIL